jgi:multidrug transporter EmrE-like cation transporter
MPITVFAVVMLAALLHASWNAIVKSAPDKFLTTVMVTTMAAGLSAVLVPFLTEPALSSFPYAIASAFLQVIYFLLVARTYQVADMSQAYPLMRGTAPLIVAVVSTFQMDDALSHFAWMGVMAICAGIFDRWDWGQEIGRAGGLHALGLSTDRSAARTLGNHGEKVHVCSLRRPPLAAGDCRGNWNGRILWTGVMGDDSRPDCSGRRASRDLHTVCYSNCGLCSAGAHRT